MLQGGGVGGGGGTHQIMWYREGDSVKLPRSEACYRCLFLHFLMWQVIHHLEPSKLCMGH